MPVRPSRWPHGSCGNTSRMLRPTTRTPIYPNTSRPKSKFPFLVDTGQHAVNLSYVRLRTWQAESCAIFCVFQLHFSDTPTSPSVCPFKHIFVLDSGRKFVPVGDLKVRSTNAKSPHSVSGVTSLKSRLRSAVRVLALCGHGVFAALASLL